MQMLGFGKLLPSIDLWKRTQNTCVWPCTQVTQLIKNKTTLLVFLHTGCSVLTVALPKSFQKQDVQSEGVHCSCLPTQDPHA